MELKGLLTQIQNSWREDQQDVKKEDKKDDDKSKLSEDPSGKSKQGDKTTSEKKEDAEEEKVLEEPEHWAIARAEGWMPKEEWLEAGRDEEEWKPAKAFIQDGAWKSELRKLKRAVKRKEKQVDALVKERDVIHKSAYEAGRQSILKRREQAIKDENLDEVVKAGDELAELEKKAAATKDLKVEDKKEYEISDEEKVMLRQWGVDNQWYMNDLELQGITHQVAAQFMEENEDATLIEAFEFAGTQVRTTYPQKVRGGKKVASAVTDVQPTRRSASDKTGTVRVPRPDQLPEELRDLYKNFSAAGMFKTDKNPKGKLDYNEWVTKSLAKD